MNISLFTERYAFLRAVKTTTPLNLQCIGRTKALLSVYQIRGAHLSGFLVCRSSLVYRWIESLPFGVNIVGEEVPPVAIFHHGALR